MKFVFRLRSSVSWMGCVLPLSMSVVGCLEDEPSQVENLEDKLDGLTFDINRSNEFIAKEKAKLTLLRKAKSDSELSKRLSEEMAVTTTALEELTVEAEELRDSVELTDLESEQHLAKYRVKVRKEAVGTNVDLSATKGEDYKESRILSISPIGIKVYRPSGPENVPVEELAPDVLERFQLSQDEVAKYEERRLANATLRAEKFKKWKEGYAERKEEAAKEALDKKIREIQEEILQREKVITSKISQIKGWKTRASLWEKRASQLFVKPNARMTAKKAVRLGELAREKAQVLADENSNSWIVISRLKFELMDLKELRKTKR